MIFFTNQIRMKIGVMFGSPETTTGGNALKFYASMRLDVRRIGAIKETLQAGKEPTVVGNRTRVKVVKNKMAPPFREVEFDILYGQGVSRSGEVLDLAADSGIVQKSGAWYALDSERIGQGRDAARSFLEQKPKLLDQLEERVLRHHGIARSSGGEVTAAVAAENGGAKPAKTDEPSPAPKAAPTNGAAKRPAPRA
jgi:recombination protein RecA